MSALVMIDMVRRLLKWLRGGFGLLAELESCLFLMGAKLGTLLYTLLSECICNKDPWTMHLLQSIKETSMLLLNMVTLLLFTYNQPGMYFSRSHRHR